MVSLKIDTEHYPRNGDEGVWELLITNQRDSRDSVVWCLDRAGKFKTVNPSAIKQWSCKILLHVPSPQKLIGFSSNLFYRSVWVTLSIILIFEILYFSPLFCERYGLNLPIKLRRWRTTEFEIDLIPWNRKEKPPTSIVLTLAVGVVWKDAFK